MTSDMFFPAFFVLFVLIAIAFAIVQSRRRRAGGAAPGAKEGGAGERSEAYFRSMVPELQPHFHPEKVLRFVRERKGSRNVIDGYSWRNPPGFETAAAVVAMTGGRERIRLMDAAGTSPSPVTRPTGATRIPCSSPPISTPAAHNARWSISQKDWSRGIGSPLRCAKPVPAQLRRMAHAGRRFVSRRHTVGEMVERYAVLLGIGRRDIIA